MKLACTPEINMTDKSVTMNFNDEQWDILCNVKFDGLWFFVRMKGGE